MRRRARVALGGGLLAALAVVVVAVLAFPTGAAVRGTSKPVELPHELEQTVFETCLPGLNPASIESVSDAGGVHGVQGFIFSSEGAAGRLSVGIESVGDWSVSVNRSGATLQNERPSADETQITTIASSVVPAAQSLYNCMATFRFAAHDTEPPSSGTQLLQLYRYDTNVLWPCLASQGIDVGDPPSRDQFVNSFSARTADPFSAMKLTNKTLPRLTAALRACPLRPAYLG